MSTCQLRPGTTTCPYLTHPCEFYSQEVSNRLTHLEVHIIQGKATEGELAEYTKWVEANAASLEARDNVYRGACYWPEILRR